jgi:hypothetical protein
LPFDTSDAPQAAAAAGPPVDPIDEALAALNPPRKYY